MHTPQTHPPTVEGVSRHQLLKAGLAAGATLSALPLYDPPTLWGEAAGQPRRSDILRVRGRTRRTAIPIDFDHGSRVAAL
jgi:hypothetical protein